eukprot:scaffold2552_cov380-Prasinococcus_capsulatus_cf.AAC.32
MRARCLAGAQRRSFSRRAAPHLKPAGTAWPGEAAIAEEGGLPALPGTRYRGNECVMTSWAAGSTLYM